MALNRAGDYGAAFAVLTNTMANYDSYAGLDAALAANLAQTRVSSATYAAPMAEAALKGAYWQASNTARGRDTLGQARRTSKP